MEHTLHVGRGTSFGAVTLFPVWTNAPGLNGFDWSGAALRVAEREGAPVVGELVVQNTGARPVVLLEGDLLAGGWQDRMVAASTILGRGDGRVVEVVCVEHGRWGGEQAHGARGRRGAASVRYGLDRARHPEQSRGGCDGDNGGEQRDEQGEPAQQQVWQRIGRFESERGGTKSSSMLDHLGRAPQVDARRLPGQRGVVVGIGGVVAWGEMFGSTAGLASRWDGLLNAAMLDAQLAPAVSTPASAARHFVSGWAAMPAMDTQALAAIEEAALDSLFDPVPLEHGGDAHGVAPIVSRRGKLSLSGTRHRDRLVHATVFNTAHPQMEHAGGHA
ncbi:hypothetical protein RCH16_003596 [Cryobacterium sp. MP_M5]|uniref:ARPP-1 family domain-containing protein n=1 Tax=unclassified Cryobacterium TaxID=2649013 RepID=UPI0018C9B865|nr:MULTISPECIES: DUF6569 family protein [unclassified Cryobacterium]MBG6058974.1 hypothetical protein [Cryobacterium sp. MP_M3]MEC5178557.1 hypothetical protein [Cryobacterium sp. MP_M5]